MFETLNYIANFEMEGVLLPHNFSLLYLSRNKQWLKLSYLFLISNVVLCGD